MQALQGWVRHLHGYADDCPQAKKNPARGPGVTLQRVQARFREVKRGVFPLTDDCMVHAQVITSALRLIWERRFMGTCRVIIFDFDQVLKTENCRSGGSLARESVASSQYLFHAHCVLLLIAAWGALLIN